MKRTILVAMFMITAFSVSFMGQKTDKKSEKDEKAKKEVIALADAYFKASVKMDAETMERILADDFVSIESSDDESSDMTGTPIDKGFLITLFKGASPSGLRLADIQMDEIVKRVRIFGDTAVLYTKITLKWQGDREELAKKYKFMPKTDEKIVTLVAIKKNGTWQIITTHQSVFRLIARETPNPN
jgi:hypothetical protein